jgi:hypothetical protein
LANGTTTTASLEGNTDLFWALRGAGHNFGIVSSVEYKIYDRTPENEKWTVENHIFTQDKLEQVLDAANELMDKYKDNPEFGHWLEFFPLPDIDSKVSMRHWPDRVNTHQVL